MRVEGRSGNEWYLWGQAARRMASRNADETTALPLAWGGARVVGTGERIVKPATLGWATEAGRECFAQPGWAGLFFAARARLGFAVVHILRAVPLTLWGAS